MMFIIEKSISDYRKSIKNWEEACDKWVRESPYRYKSEYERRHPRPYERAKLTAGMTAVAIVTSIILFGLFSFLVSVNEESKAIANAAKKGANCRMFNRDDRVRITDGDYNNTTGAIIGGCNKGEEYQIKLDAGTKANIGNDGLDEIDVSGRIIGISSYKDLVEIKKEK